MESLSVENVASAIYWLGMSMGFGFMLYLFFTRKKQTLKK